MEKTENNGQALGTTSSAHSWSRQCQPAQTSSGENSRRKVQNVLADSRVICQGEGDADKLADDD
jgi:hypothetical protein